MKDDEIALPIEAFDAANGGGVGWYEDKGAYHLYLLETEAPIARLKPVGTNDEVRLGYWSHLSSGNLGLFRTFGATAGAPSIQRPFMPRSTRAALVGDISPAHTFDA